MFSYTEPARGRNPASPAETPTRSLRIGKIRQRFGLVGPLASVVADLAYGPPRFEHFREMSGNEQVLGAGPPFPAAGGRHE